MSLFVEGETFPNDVFVQLFVCYGKPYRRGKKGAKFYLKTASICKNLKSE